MCIMGAGASEVDLARVESALGVQLTPEHRELLVAENGWERCFGNCFLTVYGTDDLVAVNREVEGHPGFLAIASDGSRELIGFDMRVDTPPVVMIDITSAGWDEALFQADSLSEFLEQRARHEDLRWEVPYQPRT